jgi:hypothetical protein
VQALRAQLRETGTRRIEPGELRASVEGTVGWAVDRGTMRLPNGIVLTVRETPVFHREDGEWKIAQFRASLAVPNSEAFG